MLLRATMDLLRAPYGRARRAEADQASVHPDQFAGSRGPPLANDRSNSAEAML
jgi:hypothetical protein